MDTQEPDTGFDKLFVRNMVESALRIGLLFILLSMSYDVIRPFVTPITWGAIIAIAAFPLTRWLETRLGGRRGMAAALVSLVFIIILVVPSFLLTESLLGAAKSVSVQLNEGNLEVPPPPTGVAEWPVVGERVHEFWSRANQNLEAVLAEVHPQLKAGLSKLVASIGSGLAGVAMFVISLIIAGGFMAYAESAGAATQKFFVRIGGLNPGGAWRELIVATVRNVLKGVVGVAVIQAILCSIGLFAMQVPAAAVWSAVILFLAIAQLPAMLVVLPLIIWAYSANDATSATLFAVWMVLAGLSDNILKPMLMGRGLDVPMPVILLGAIGGMLAAGIIGLFAGAVVLSVWYKLFGEWLAQDSH